MEQTDRPDPDELLADLHREEKRQKRGTLKVFLGMCAGVGKTYAMLEAAQKAKREGRDVVIGYVETHGRRETEVLTEGIEAIPRKPVVYRGTTLSEMDLDAVLARQPPLAVVDELAHTNAPGSRHPKRYQDVMELLDAGIDVYTTLNVQHIESRADTVREITGATIRETVPDTILAEAEIELVDLSPEDLLQRLAEGKVYVPERAEAAARNFLREGNLIALREMALHLAAERVGQDVRDYMQARKIAGPWKTGHRLLVAVSASPYSEQMVRWTRRLADSLGCTWIAAHVETSRVLSEEEQTRLTRNLSLARALGAEVRGTTDEDVVRGLLRVAREQNVTQIVVGTPYVLGPSILSAGARRLQRLIREAGSIDVHVVRAEGHEDVNRRPLWCLPAEAEWPQYFKAVAVVGAVTLVNEALAGLIGSRTVGLIFLMTVVGLAMFLNRGPVYLAATVSALVWDLLFLPPPLTFNIGNFEDAVMFAMYFIVALAMGHLISRIRARERMDRRREERATAMYMLTLELGDASTWEEIEHATVSNVERAFKADAALLLPDASGNLRGDLPEKELGAAVWAYEHVQPAGRFTDTLPMTEAIYLPLHTGGGALGVLRLRWRQSSPPTIEQRTMLDGFQRHISLVVDRQRLRESKAHSHLLAESERLSQVLLNAVSHELRTPIAAIETAASGWHPGLDPALQNALVAEIREATARLSRLVANLLDMARLESGHVKPRMDWCDVNDIVNAALKRGGSVLANRDVSVKIPSSFPLVQADSRLIEQALVDLLFNAAMYTPAGTPVEVNAVVEEQKVAITVADRGPGLSAEAIPRIFDKFYRAPGAAAGGTGLGLSIVKGFVEAHGGNVHVVNRPAGGAAFTITLPLQETPKA
ncbi:MAG: sensor histidine kinase KdpD [Kiritimatiellaeota bacterium]|nr:sensor histidine kinase KdpD [Kiritimatiellota bacterium]